MYDHSSRDADGYVWITGRVDDMLNCSGRFLLINDAWTFLVLYRVRNHKISPTAKHLTA